MDMSSYGFNNQAIRFGHEGTVVVELDDSLVVYAYAHAGTSRAFPSRGTSLIAVDDNRAIVEGYRPSRSTVDAAGLARQANERLAHMGLDVDLEGGVDECDEDGVEMERAVFSLCLETGGWTRASRPSWPFVSVEDQTWTSVRREDGATARLWSTSARLSTDCRWLRVGEEVYDTRDLHVVATTSKVEIEDVMAFTRVDGRLLTIGRRQDASFVVRDDEVLFELDEQPLVATFDTEGQRIALLDANRTLTVLRIAPRVTVARVAL